MDFVSRPLAITDVETTGLDWRINEIIEIGLIVVRQSNLEIIDKWESKVKPEHIETAHPKALELNGYNEQDWQAAISLQEAMEVYTEKTQNGLLTAHNPANVDWPFLKEAFLKASYEISLDYHMIDLFSLAWAYGRETRCLLEYNLDKLCRHFGIPEEPRPHRAMNGAMREYQVLKRLA